MTSTYDTPIYDVIVAGAGPVGLFLACELALARCSVLLLEQAEQADSPFKTLPFGIRGLSAPTIEAFARRGLLQELEVPKRLADPFSTGKAAAPRRGGHFAGIQFSEDDVDMVRWPWRLPSSTGVQLIAEMAELEAVLARRACALGVEILRGSAVTGVAQDARTVQVTAGGRVFAGRWLVGCDGGRSTVRKAGGFDFAGTDPEFTGYLARVDILDPEKLKPGRKLMPTGLYFQSQPGYLVLQDFDGGAGHGVDAVLTRARLEALLRRISETDVTLGAVHAASTWTDRARQATDYRKGRIVLAGDAAHIHAPLGGQGLNLGLGDAMNLGWKLAATVRGTAPGGLLDTYQSERHPIGAQVLDWSRAQVAIMRPTPDGRALRAVVQDLLRTRDGATYVAGRVWGMHMRYDLGGNHPLVGRSVPNFVFDDGATVDDLLRAGRGLLLDFPAQASLAAIANAYVDRIDHVAGRVADSLGLRAALVRPDGVVAWASDELIDEVIDEDALRQAISRWFG